MYAIDPFPGASAYLQCSVPARFNLRILRIKFLLKIGLLSFILAIITGCGNKRAAQVQVSPAPPISAADTRVPQQTTSGSEGGEPSEPGISASAKAIYTETGMASWYRPSYNHRKAANGEVYDMDH